MNNAAPISVSRMAWREITHHRANAAGSALVVALAVGLTVGAVAVLRQYEQQTVRILETRKQEVDTAMRDLEARVHTAMLHGGFTHMLVPAGQECHDWYRDNYAALLLPDENLKALEEAEWKSLGHFVPLLRGRMRRPETGRTVIVVGQAPSALHPLPGAKELKWNRLQRDEVSLGHELHRHTERQPGNEFVMGGKSFRIVACHPAQGSRDDITVYMALEDAQQLLGKPGRVNQVLCVITPTGVAEPDVLRDELAEKAAGMELVARKAWAEAGVAARTGSARAAQAMLDRVRRQRGRRLKMARHVAIAVTPLALLACCTWLSVLVGGNVRERIVEIGVCRAMGYGDWQIAWLIGARVLLIALAGTVLGGAGGAYWARMGLSGWLLALALSMGLALPPGVIAMRMALRDSPAKALSGV